MKFLIIHNEYSRRGGEESVVEMQRRLLESKGHEVIMYVRRHGEVGKFRSFFTALRNGRAIEDIRKTIQYEKPDVAIIHNLFPVISAAILPVLKKANVKVLMTLHNYRLACPNGLFYTHGKVCEKCGTSALGSANCFFNKCEGSVLGSFAWACRSAFANDMQYFSKVDKFLALSKFQRSKITKYNKLLDYDKFEIAPNCIDISAMSESSLQRGDFIGFVGRVSREKGMDLLFETAKRLPQVTFKIAGEEAARFESGAVPRNVEFVGFLDKQALADFYSSARAVILTSSCYEGFPLTVIEAMYYRATVIVPNWAALPEIVDNGACGVLYEPNNAEDLAAKILEKHDFGESGRRRIIEKYNSEQYYMNIMRCI